MNIIEGYAAIAIGDGWVGVIAGNRYCETARRTSEEALEDARKMLEEATRTTDEEDRQSKKAFIEAIIKYVDAKTEYEIESRQRDGEGYLPSCKKEEKAMEAAKEELIKA